MNLEVFSSIGTWFVPTVWDCRLISETDWGIIRQNSVLVTIRDLMLVGF